MDEQRNVALVTGGGGGIGRAEAVALARAKIDIAVAYRSDLDKAEATVAACREHGVRAQAFGADLSQGTSVARLVDDIHRQLGPVAVLVNNAGMMGHDLNRPLIDLDEDRWHRVLDSHLTASYLCIKHCAPDMIAAGWGRIVNTSSVHGRVGARPTLGAYGAAKAGIEALTKTAARELARHGITCNAVAPGFISTGQLQGALSQDRLADLARQTPVGRLGEADEIAAVVAFLASSAASYVNGAIIDVNGGRTEYV